MSSPYHITLKDKDKRLKKTVLDSEEQVELDYGKVSKDQRYTKKMVKRDGPTGA